MTNKAEAMNGVERVVMDTVRKVDYNTYEYKTQDGDRCIRLHHTTIVRFTADGGLVLDSGGWKTPTTKERINKFIGARGLSIYQKRGVWYIIGSSDTELEFYDGIVLDRENKRVAGAKEAIMVAAQKKRVEKWMAKAKKMAAKIKKDGPPLPNGGDCWCCMFLTNREGAPPTIEELMADKEHLLKHLDENYLHGTLVVLAMLVRGFDMNSIKHYFWMATESSDTTWGRLVLSRHLLAMYKQILGVAR